MVGRMHRDTPIASMEEDVKGHDAQASRPGTAGFPRGRFLSGILHTPEEVRSNIEMFGGILDTMTEGVDDVVEVSYARRERCRRNAFEPVGSPPVARRLSEMLSTPQPYASSGHSSHRSLRAAHIEARKT